MKKLIHRIRGRVQDCFALLYSMILALCGYRLRRLARSCSGDIAVSTIGGIIITVVVIGLLVLAINAFFPGFFTNIFTSMSQKLNANW